MIGWDVQCGEGAASKLVSLNLYWGNIVIFGDEFRIPFVEFARGVLSHSAVHVFKAGTDDMFFALLLCRGFLGYGPGIGEQGNAAVAEGAVGRFEHGAGGSGARGCTSRG